MREYELTVVFHPDLEMNIDPALEKVKKIIESNGGKITHEEVDGKKRMAYTIKKQDFGVYYYFEVELAPEAPNKISTVLNITDEVLRYELVKADPRKAKYEARRAEKAAREEARAAENGEASAEVKASEEAVADEASEKVGDDTTNKE